MFQVGDGVVYPLHGAGIIEAVEEREVLGGRRPYYVLKMPAGEMRLLIPTEAADRCGLRPVVPAETVPRVLEVLRQGPPDLDLPWNHRYRQHAEKLKSGDVFAVAEVVRNLTWRQREKGLAAGERRLLETARQILVSELALAGGMDQEDAGALVDRQLVVEAGRRQGAGSS